MGAVNDTSRVGIIDVLGVLGVLGVWGVWGAAMAVVASTDRRRYHAEVCLAVALRYLGTRMGAVAHGALN